MKHNGIYYDCEGRGDAVVLIHGLSADHRVWDDQLAALSRQYRVVRLDLRGFGKSAAISEPYSHADDIKSILDRLEIRSAHIVGHSMGAAVGGDFVQTYPEATRSWVLANGILTGWPLQHLMPTLMPIVATAMQGDIAGAKRMWIEHAMFEPARRNPQVRANLQRVVDDYSGWHFANPENPRERKPPVSTADALEKLAVPTLAIVGELDLPDFQEIAAAVATRAPGATKVVIPGVGHLANVEQPEQFNRVLLQFLGREFTVG
jgi:3-oxoadipate enol-lactonase